MKLILCGFLIALCILSSASATPAPDLLTGESLRVANTLCFTGHLLPEEYTLSQLTNNILFELRTPCKRTEYRVSEVNKLRDSPDFDARKKTVVFVAGFNSNMNESYTRGLTQAYHCRGGHNFIVVNTLKYIQGSLQEYIYCAQRTTKLGEAVAVGLKNLNIPGKDIHLVGHSLGAHIVGSAGDYFQQTTKDKVGRITGLDPARPCFVNTPIFRRLQAKDAVFVDIIHTNVEEAGTEEAIGHADFYPGGLERTQPGCIIFVSTICSHIRSILYYTETVYTENERNFIATECSNKREVTACGGTKTPMGFAADEKARGVFYLKVSSAAPYGNNAKPSSGRNLETCGICRK